MDDRIPSPFSPESLPERSPADFGARAVAMPADPRMVGGSGEEEGINLLRILFYILQYRKVIAVVAALCLVLGLIITFLQERIYQATARMEVLTQSAKVVEDLQVVRESGDLRAFLTTREKLKSRALAERVVYDLGLSQRADFLFPPARFSLRRLFDRIFVQEAERQLDGYTAQQREQLAVNTVVLGTDVSLLPNTSILIISFRHHNAAHAERVANQLVKSYIDQRLDQTGETSSLTRQFIEDQVAAVKQRLQASEEELVRYSKEEDVNITGEASTLLVANLNAVNSAYNEALRQRLDSELLIKQINAGRAAYLPQMMDNQSLASTRTKIAELRAEYQDKLGSFKPAFPEMRQLQARIQELERQFSGAMTVMVDSIKLRHADNVDKEQRLKAELEELKKSQASYMDKNIRYTILKREVDSNRSQFESLIRKLNEVGVGAELKNQTAAMVEPAVRPGAPISPNLRLNMAIAFAVSLLLSAAVIYGIELLNNTFRIPDQVEQELGLPVLGILPHINDQSIVEALEDKNSSLSEAYRSLRTSLQFSGSFTSPRTILVTSSEPREGKSTTAFKLAHEFAALDQNVLIIDSDLRKPIMHRHFGVQNTIGLANLLSNTLSGANVSSVFQETSMPNLTFLSAGTIPHNPADLLSSPKMARCMSALAQRFDTIIIDGPPVIGLSDAPLLSRIFEATLFVVSSNQVSRKSARSAMKRLKAAGGYVVGVALTKFSVESLEYNYSYRYMNYHYYNYGPDNKHIRGQGNDRRSKSSRDNSALGDWSAYFDRAVDGLVKYFRPPR